MKNLFIVANWKSNKTISQATTWLAEISNLKSQISNNTNKEIIVCPSFTLLSDLKSSIKLGAQDISPFGPGAYTGEVNGEQIKEFADYVLIGHSERRKNFKEDDTILKQKVKRAIENNITPIFCVQDSSTLIPDGLFLIAYEPVFAIGTGNPDTPENANMIAEEIKRKNKDIQYVLYGGSVNAENVHNFTSCLAIDGVLVGGASLDANGFLEIIKNA